MALSADTRELLNKGNSLYKFKLGDLINDAIVEGLANRAADVVDADEDTSWGIILSQKIAALEEKASANQALEALLLKAQDDIAALKQGLSYVLAIMEQMNMDGMKQSINFVLDNMALRSEVNSTDSILSAKIDALTV